LPRRGRKADVPYTTVDDVRLYFEEVPNSDAPPLLLIHGAAQDTLSWRFNLDFLGSRFHVYAIDLPGHGKSQMAPEGPIDSLEAYAAYAERFMTRLGVAHYSVVGHSMAGGIGLHMALRHPEHLDMVALLDGACYTSGTYGEEVFDLVSINPTDWFEVNFRTICSPKTSPQRVEEIAFDVRRCAPEVAMNDIRAYAALDLRQRVGNVTIPVVAIHGEEDWSIPPELGKRTTELTGGPSLFLPLGGVGHFPHTEAPELFHAAFEKALETIDVRFGR
jgi:pimeloyl-ACP methyl ester carboxylesterase